MASVSLAVGDSFVSILKVSDQSIVTIPTGHFPTYISTCDSVIQPCGRDFEHIVTAPYILFCKYYSACVKEIVQFCKNVGLSDLALQINSSMSLVLMMHR